MYSFKGKIVLVAGGTGLIGRPLVELLLKEGAYVRIASLDDPSCAPDKTDFWRIDLTSLDNCMAVCMGMDYVFNLLCIKGSPEIANAEPEKFYVPHLMFNTNLMEAARRCKTEGFLFTSTFGVYAPAEIFYEDDMWEYKPSPNDWFAAHAKRAGELQAEAYQKSKCGWGNISIVRPASTYGPYDNFDLKSAMVVPSLIKKAVDGMNPLEVWGDGTQVRDFVHARDVARGMLHIVKIGYRKPVNLGSGTGVAIKELVEVILENVHPKPDVVYDTSKPSGDKKRILDTSRARSLGWEPIITLREGIKETVEWYRANKDKKDTRYNIFEARSNP